MVNRLTNATSPYLLQHADNPVDWWEWEPAAFEEARRRNVPVLLSVGYAACHWCHVMAHESFEDAETAAVLNERFVSVKLDKLGRASIAVDDLNGGRKTSYVVVVQPTSTTFAATSAVLKLR